MARAKKTKKPSPRRPAAPANPFGLVVPPAPFQCPVAPDYRGDVFIWDLDKTYLRTEFTNIRGLIRTAFEKARDKAAYPGASALLQGLRTDSNGKPRPIYFVSASPPQIGRVIREKFALDGISVDGIYFKDNLKNVRPGRFNRLKEQVGYKLLALLHLREQLPSGAIETMFGDDYETDAATYALYSELLERWIRRGDLVDVLLKQGVHRDEAVRIAWRARRIPPRQGVRRIFIRLDKATDPRYYRRFGDQVTGVRNFFQTAALLYLDGTVSLDTVVAVGDDLVESGRFERAHLADNLKDVEQRRLVTREAAGGLREELIATGLLKKNRS